MNIYDKAYELKNALIECQEVKDYKNAYEKIKKSPSNKKMLDDLRQKQFELQAEQLSGQEIDKTKMEQLEKLYNVISLNNDINEFLQYEYKFSILMNDISQIISDAIGIDLEDEVNNDI